MKREDTVRKAREFFETVVRIYGENQLYKAIFGELPIDENSEKRIKRLKEMNKNAQSFLSLLGEYVGKEQK